MLPNDNAYIDMNGETDKPLQDEGDQQARRDWLFANDMVYLLDGPEQREAQAEAEAPGAEFNAFCTTVFNDNVAMGWYTDPATGLRKERNVGELLMLIVSEVAEGMEGYRKNLADDKLPHRSMLEVEMADAVIRIADLCGYLGLDLGGAIVEKRAFNASRADHKLENRIKSGGKAF